MKRPTYKQKEVTKKKEFNYDELANNVYSEINLARSQPLKYAEILERDMEFFKEEILYRPDEEPLRTQEGEAAHIEAIEFLKTQVSLPELIKSDKLEMACLDHAIDIGDNGLYSHDGSGKEIISQRLEKYAEWDYVLCQNIDFGAKTAHEVVVSFLTCDGDSTRINRNNIFNPNTKYIGVASAPHRDSEIMTVLCFAGNIRDLNSVPPEMKNFVSNYIRKLDEERANPKSRKIKTKFQIEDPDAPDNAINYTTFKKIKLIEDRAKHCTQRVYTLSDGNQHIVELFDDLKVRASSKS